MWVSSFPCAQSIGDYRMRVCGSIATRWYRAPEILLASSKYVVLEIDDSEQMTMNAGIPKVLTCGPSDAFSEKFYSASHSSKERRRSISWSVSFSIFQHRATRILPALDHTTDRAFSNVQRRGRRSHDHCLDIDSTV